MVVQQALMLASRVSRGVLRQRVGMRCNSGVAVLADDALYQPGLGHTHLVLVDLRPHLAIGDYGHGAAHIWSETGNLLATASQTASMLHFDVSAMPGNSA